MSKLFPHSQIPPPLLCHEKSLPFLSPLCNEFSPLGPLSPLHYYSIDFILSGVIFVFSPIYLCSTRPSGPGKRGLGHLYSPASLFSSFSSSPGTWYTFTVHRSIELLNSVDCIAWDKNAPWVRRSQPGLSSVDLHPRRQPC